MLVEPMPADVLLWLVNEWGSVPRAAAGEDAAPYPGTGLLAASLAGPANRSCPPELLTGQALTQVADGLHRVFAAADLGERVALVTGLLAGTGVRPGLELVAGRAAEAWLVEDARQALSAAAALTLRRHLAGFGPDRLGICSGRRCADAYIDASPGGRRRFCSVTCQNRARVAAWRRRRGDQVSEPDLSTAAPRRPGE